MMLSFALVASLLPLLSVFAAHSHVSRSHNEIAIKHRAEARADIEERWPSSFSGARATWYDDGLGGCGKWNKSSDFIVALNFPMFGNAYPGPQCWKWITIEYQGKSAQAQIVDACEACPEYGGIDLSRGLFTYLAGSLGPGVISVNWHFSGAGGGDGGDNSPPPPKPSPKAKPTTTWKPKPTTTWTPPPKATSSSSSHSHSHHSSSSVSSSSASSTSSSALAPVATPTGAHNIESMLQAIVGLGQVVVGGSSD